MDVYVRRGETRQERLLAFRCVPEVPTLVWFDHGWAFDGNQMLQVVTKGEYPSLQHALHAVEVDLLDLLEKYGIDRESVRFC